MASPVVHKSKKMDTATEVNTSVKATDDVKENTDKPIVQLPKPALIAFHASPAPKGQKSPMIPIGAAFAHQDGEGFTLQLSLIPPFGGPIILRPTPSPAPANADKDAA